MTEHGDGLEQGVTPREFDARLAEVQRAVDLAREPASTVALREYVEALLRERDQLREARDEHLERELQEGDHVNRDHVDTVFQEHRIANETAEREREKAAQIVAEKLKIAIETGDEHLKQHIASQVEQIRAALISASRLTEESASAMEQRSVIRNDALVERLAAQQRETQLGAEAAKEAIQKAEMANEKRFDGVNAFRQTLTDQSKDFMPREVADAQIGELRKQVQYLAEQLGKLS